MRRASIGSGASWETARFSSLQSVSITLQHPKLCSTASLRVREWALSSRLCGCLRCIWPISAATPHKHCRERKQRSSESRDNPSFRWVRRDWHFLLPEDCFPDDEIWSAELGPFLRWFTGERMWNGCQVQHCPWRWQFAPVFFPGSARHSEEALQLSLKRKCATNVSGSQVNSKGRTHNLAFTQTQSHLLLQ